jgi:tetratricopeptide (TPR) repeat protein
MIADLLRVLNYLGGAVPGGLLTLGFLLAIWLITLYFVYLPLKDMQSRDLLPKALGGSLLLVALFFLIRFSINEPRFSNRLNLWPLEIPNSAMGYAVPALEEILLQKKNLLKTEDSELAFESLELMSNRYHLSGDLIKADAANIQQIMQVLGIGVLVTGKQRGDILLLTAWEYKWNVLKQLKNSRIDLSRIKSELELSQELQSLYHEFLASLLILEPTQNPQAITLSALPLYSAINDTTELLVNLALEEFNLSEQIRFADLIINIGAQGEDHLLIEIINNSLTQADLGGVDAYLLAASWFATQGEWDKVRQSLFGAMATDPSNHRVHFLISHLNKNGLREFGYQSQYDARLASLGHHPAFRTVLYGLVPELIDNRLVEQARQACEVQRMIFPSDYELILLEGNIAYVQYDHQTALDNFSLCVTRRPADPRAWLNLSQLYFVIKDYENAIPALQKAVNFGGPPRLLYLLGVSHIHLGQKQKGGEYLRKHQKLGRDPEELQRGQQILRGLFTGQDKK